MTEPLQHGYADLGDLRLHYVTAAEGPAVVLLHGWPQTWFMWRDVIAGLAPHHRVIAPDLRGRSAVMTRRRWPTTSGA